MSSPSGNIALSLGPKAVEGHSTAMQNLWKMLGRIAPTELPVLVLGPTGCGKEVIAQQLHRESLRPASPFVDINCSSIPESLMEAELFGHQKGAFTGAVSNRVGYFGQVGDGTIFLDEIGDLPLAMQPKLLRVLETRQFRSVGSNEPFPFRGRVVAATHRDLPRMIREGQFREDLYYRLNVFTLEIPGLDQRREDIPVLAQHFATNHSRPFRFQETALRLLTNASWPGNVRQLRNMVDRIAVLMDEASISAEHVAPFLQEPQSHFQRDFEDVADRLLQVEGEDKISVLEHLLVDKVLRDCAGNKTAAARVLGVNRKVIERRVQAHTENLQEARLQCERAKFLLETSEHTKLVEAIDRALAALRTLPLSPEARRLRFEVLKCQGVCKRSQEGWLSSEALNIHAEALRIGRGVVDSQELSSLMFGTWTAHLMRLELDPAKELAKEIRLRGIEAEDVDLQIDGCIAMANTCFWLGEFEDCLEYIDELRRLPRFGVPCLLRQGMDPRALATLLEALAAHQQGNAPRAQKALQELQAMAVNLDHAFSQAIAIQGCAWVECAMGNRTLAGQWAMRLQTLSETHHFTFYHGLARILLGYSGILEGDAQSAETAMQQGFGIEMAAHGGLLFHSFYGLLLTRHYLEQGQAEKAEVTARQAIQVSMEHRELAYLGELLCVRGKALAALGRTAEAEEVLRCAISTALGLCSAPARKEALKALEKPGP